MKRLHAIGVLALVAGAFAAGAISATYGGIRMSGTKYQKTLEPMLLAAEGEAKNFYMLPPGTPLYKVRSYAEGHTTYLVYLNIKGKFANQAMESEHENLIDPIWATPVEVDDVPKLLGETPLTRDDLVRILKARAVSKDDLAYIVRELDK
jgi:hypothetical protein